VKLLQSYDDNFDVCRSFLIVSMVITHIFEMFYLPDYNRRLTYYVTIGFVFLSGFTVGALYSERIRINPQKYAKKLMGRAYKLLLLFVICNFFILLISQSRFNILIKLNIFDIVISIFLGTNQDLFGFDILIPIALTSFFSWSLLKALNNRLSLVFIFFFLLFLWFSETVNVLNYYGVKFLLIGIIGCLIGKLASNLDWSRALKTLSRSYATIICGILILIYYATMFLFSKQSGPIKVHYHLIPTVIMMFFVYILSYDFQLNDKLLIKIPNKTLSKNILFAYLFHLLVINILFLFIRKDSLSFFGTSVLALFVLSFTIATCYFVDFLNLKSVISARIYSSLFKL